MRVVRVQEVHTGCIEYVIVAHIVSYRAARIRPWNEDGTRVDEIDGGVLNLIDGRSLYVKSTPVEIASLLRVTADAQFSGGSL